MQQGSERVREAPPSSGKPCTAKTPAHASTHHFPAACQARAWVRAQAQRLASKDKDRQATDLQKAQLPTTCSGGACNGWASVPGDPQRSRQGQTPAKLANCVTALLSGDARHEEHAWQSHDMFLDGQSSSTRPKSRHHEQPGRSRSVHISASSYVLRDRDGQVRTDCWPSPAVFQCLSSAECAPDRRSHADQTMQSNLP